MSQFSDCNRDEQCLLVAYMKRQEAERLKRWIALLPVWKKDEAEYTTEYSIEVARREMQSRLDELEGKK